MKANEAPEKIYVSNYSSGLTYNWHNERLAVNDVEYTRTDAFIEKTLKFLDENFFFNNLHYSIESGVFDSKEEMFEDFKNYMEK